MGRPRSLQENQRLAQAVLGSYCLEAEATQRASQGSPGRLAEGSLECSGLGAPAQPFPSLGLSLSIQKQLLARLKGGQPHPVCSDRGASKC